MEKENNCKNCKHLDSLFFGAIVACRKNMLEEREHCTKYEKKSE